MPDPITPVNAWTTPINAPANGDPVDGGAGSPAKTMGQGLADRIEFASKRLLGASDTAIIYHLPWIVLPSDPANGPWYTARGPGPEFAIQQDDVAQASVLVLELLQPVKGTLTSLSVYMKGTAGRGGWPLGTAPGYTLYRQDTSADGGPTALFTRADTSASAVAYETTHLVATNIGLSLPMDPAALFTKYFLLVTGEFGANALAGLSLMSVRGGIEQ